ncbi:MAG: hypothetical protein RDV48_10225 [Candidatus Eremiobacteraeota bacterium]|nr:hypothetical protein [Candidatus Eremiobacteraeota bacterium]
MSDSKTSNHKGKAGAHGIILFMALVIMVILFILCVSFISIVSNNYFTGSMGISTTEAFWLADSGIEYALEALRTNGVDWAAVPLDSGGWGAEIYSPSPLIDKGANLKGYFCLVLKLHSEDWRGRGKASPTGRNATYPEGEDYVYPPPSHKYRPYLLCKTGGGALALTAPSMKNRIIIRSTGIIRDDSAGAPPLPAARVLSARSLYAVYSMTCEELELWSEWYR